MLFEIGEVSCKREYIDYKFQSLLLSITTKPAFAGLVEHVLKNY